MFACCLLFLYGSCAALRVKIESIYIYSVFIWGRHSRSVECLSYWHTCCVSSWSTETQWHWLFKPVCHATLFWGYIPLDANSVTRWRWNVIDSLCFNEITFQIDFRFQVLILLIDNHLHWKQLLAQSVCVLNINIIHLLEGSNEVWFQICSHHCIAFPASNGF